MVVVTRVGGGPRTLFHVRVLAEVGGLLADQQFDSQIVDIGRVSCH